MTIEERLSQQLNEKDNQIEALRRLNDIVACRKENLGLQNVIQQQKNDLENYVQHSAPNVIVLVVFLIGALLGCLIGCAIMDVTKGNK